MNLIDRDLRQWGFTMVVQLKTEISAFGAQSEMKNDCFLNCLLNVGFFVQIFAMLKLMGERLQRDIIHNFIGFGRHSFSF